MQYSRVGCSTRDYMECNLCEFFLKRYNTWVHWCLLELGNLNTEWNRRRNQSSYKIVSQSGKLVFKWWIHQLFRLAQKLGSFHCAGVETKGYQVRRDSSLEFQGGNPNKGLGLGSPGSIPWGAGHSHPIHIALVWCSHSNRELEFWTVNSGKNSAKWPRITRRDEQQAVAFRHMKSQG